MGPFKTSPFGLHVSGSVSTSNMGKRAAEVRGPFWVSGHRSVLLSKADGQLWKILSLDEWHCSEPAPNAGPTCGRQACHAGFRVPKGMAQ